MKIYFLILLHIKRPSESFEIALKNKNNMKECQGVLHKKLHVPASTIALGY